MKNFKVKDGPFVQAKDDTSRIMNRLMIALIPIILFCFYKNGIVPFYYDKVNVFGLFYPLIFVILPALVCYGVELLFARFVFKKKKDDLKDYMKHSYAFIPGLFLGLIMPIHTPIGLLVLGAVISTVVGKMLYGGFGHNIFNPALIGRFFIITMYALVISNHGGYLNAYEADTITSATPLTNASMVDGIGNYDTLVAPYGSLWNFFVGTIPGAMGETSALLCLLAFFYLTFTKVIKWRIPVFYVGTVWLMTFVIGMLGGSDLSYSLFQILSGGLFFGAVFMATDPVTSPITSFGQVIYGICLGLLTVVCRYLTPYPEGVLTSILIMNLFVVITDKIGNRAKFDMKYVMIPLFVLLFMGGVFTYIIGSQYQDDSNYGDPNFSIEEKQVDGNEVHYVVTQKGYQGDIRASIVIDNGVATEFEIISCSDSFYEKVESVSYTQQLLAGQKNLEGVDTISGVTVTSSALKKMFVNTLEDYQNSNFSIDKSDQPIIPSEPDDFLASSDFQVLDVQESDGQFVYTVLQKGFQSDLKLEVIFMNDVITSIVVLEQGDSYFQKIVDEDYLNQLLQGQSDFESVDTVSGATISSQALKDAVTSLLDYHNGEEVHE